MTSNSAFPYWTFSQHPYTAVVVSFLAFMALCLLAYGVGLLAMGLKRGDLSRMKTLLLGVGVLTALNWGWRLCLSVFATGFSPMPFDGVQVGRGIRPWFSLFEGFDFIWIGTPGLNQSPYGLEGNGLFLMVLVPGLALSWIWLALLFYRKWFRGELTEAESSSGREGFRAWLHPKKVLPALLAVFSAEILLGLAFWPHLLFWVITLCAYPIYQTLWGMTADSGRSPGTSFTKSGEEHKKVMEMLTAGKISREEADELLNALNRQ